MAKEKGGPKRRFPTLAVAAGAGFFAVMLAIGASAETAPSPKDPTGTKTKISALALRITCQQTGINYDSPKQVQSSANYVTGQAKIDFACERNDVLTTPIGAKIITDEDEIPEPPPMYGPVRYYDVTVPFIEGQNPTYTLDSYQSPEGTGVIMNRVNYSDVAGIPEATEMS